MKRSVSRGDALKFISLIPAAVGLAAAPVLASTGPDNKKQFKYVDKPGPKGAKCSGCSLFVKPNACTLVHGKISPNGWCIAWAKK
jgi:hypothetical protein